MGAFPSKIFLSDTFERIQMVNFQNLNSKKYRRIHLKILITKFCKYDKLFLLIITMITVDNFFIIIGFINVIVT